MNARYWQIDTSRGRAQHLRRIIDELSFAVSANAVEHQLRQQGVDVGDAGAVQETLRWLVDHQDLTYGARGWVAIERSILAAYKHAADADRLAQIAFDIVAHHPDPALALRYPGAMLEAAVWQAAIRQRLGPTSSAREPVESARALIAGSGAAHLSMQLAYRDVSIRLDVDASPDDARAALDSWVIDVAWESTPWWYAADALVTIWSDGEPRAAVDRMDRAATLFATDTAISPDRHAVGVAVRLCAALIASDIESADALAERCHAILDALLELRTTEPVGALSEALGAIAEYVLAMCAYRPGPGMADVALRTADESRRAGIESVLLQPAGVRETTRRQFALLVERFSEASGAASPFREITNQQFFVPETTREVRADLVALFPRFAELASPMRCDTAALRSAVASRLLLQYVKLRTFGDAADAWHVISLRSDEVQVAAVELTDEDWLTLQNLGAEDVTWVEWWNELTSRLLPEHAIENLERGTLDSPIDVVIVADDALQRVPWPALPLTFGSPIVHSATLNVLPSVRLLIDPASMPDGAITVAAAWAETATEHVEIERAGWDRLAEVVPAIELEQIDDLFERFDLDRVHSIALVHVRGHGHRHRSGLAQSIDLPRGGQLRAVDAVTLRWPPIVTMSACHAFGVDEIDPADSGRSETFGLAMACMVGGALEVLGGREMIDARSTSTIMRDVFVSMADGAVTGLPRLLRQAQIRFLDEQVRLGEPAYAHQWALLQAASRLAV